MRIDIKPLSVNDAWQGKRFKTPKYKAFENEILLKLKPMTIPDGKLAIRIVFGLSSKSSDLDNPLKTFIDCLQKRYKFNDNMIYIMEVSKDDVSKGYEFIEFEISSIEEAY